MKILVIEPEKEPYTKDIENDFRAMQKVVEGLIEPIYFENDDTALVFCNEEFLLNGSEPNRMVGDVLVHGTFFVVGNRQNEYGEEESCSLTDEQIEEFTEMFKEPLMETEMFQDISPGIEIFYG